MRVSMPSNDLRSVVGAGRRERGRAGLARALATLLLLGVGLAIEAPVRAVAAEATALPSGRVADFPGRMVDVQGREWTVGEVLGKGPVVFAFLGTECPLAKLYAARLVALEKRFAPRGVAFVAVNPNVQDSLAAMAAQSRSCGFSFPSLKDPDQALADRFGVTRTPEVCLVDAEGRVRYRGRIDDQYGVGYTRDKPDREPLVDAIEAVLGGSEVDVATTEPVGCLIGRGVRGNAGAADGTVTYADQVSRIVQRRCVSCHREGDIGPMDLTSYDDVVAWSDMILEVVHDGRMPPWHAAPDHGVFANDRRMTADEIATLDGWVRAGAPLGDPARLPEPLSFAPGWLLSSEPDLVVPMSDRPFEVAAHGDVRYQYFEFDPKLEQDVWVRGMEIVPGNRAVVHHILVFLKNPEDRDGQGVMGDRGFLAGYVPGTRVEFMPPGYAKRIPKGHRLLFQVHYTPVGTPQEDLSRIGFWFADPATITHEVQTTSAVEHRFRIPPRAANHPVEAMLPEELPACELLGLSPHMHVRGKSFRYSAVYPDGTREVLLDVPRYDFNWQTEYRLSERKPLPKGTKIFCEAAFDNSPENLNNPDPDATVSWGEQTYEEMMIGYFHVAVPIDPATGVAAPLPRERRRMPSPQEMVKFLDTDGDGKIQRGEVPERMARFFERLDANMDGVVELEEIVEFSRNR